MAPVRSSSRRRSRPARAGKPPTKADLDRFDIRFEGPVPPRKWPKRHRHLFQVIRDIWAERYDNYRQQGEGDQKHVERYREKVRPIVDKAATFRENTGRNESTWRAKIEDSIFELFAKEIRCHHCGGELQETKHQARPVNATAAESLKQRRAERKPCTCGRPDGSVIDVDESDEERGATVFDHVVSTPVLHKPEDELQNSGIPMEPDRTYGLCKTKKIRESINRNADMSLVHSPMKEGDDLIYPFLVLEAKRAKDAPGFRSIEAQTAFSIRRFLHIQEDLRDACGADFEPLVWFFAYQGEHWRLSAATTDNRKIRVFELWLGTVESEDGALQLLQIVDFIWSWARDVFRLDIRRCLAFLPHPIKRSLSSEIPVSSIEQDESSPQISPGSSRQDDTMILTHRQSMLTVDNNHLPFLQDATSHQFLRWADRRDQSKDWARQTTIRHSDIVRFAFRIFEAPQTAMELEHLIATEPSDDVHIAMKHLLLLMQQNECTFLLQRRDILKLAKSWTGMEQQSNLRNTQGLHETVRSFIFFRSCCDSSDWQIAREIYCIVWTPAAARTFGMHFSMNTDLNFEVPENQHASTLEIAESFQQLCRLSGKHSVAYPLLGINLVLRQDPNLSEQSDRAYWQSPQDAQMGDVMIKQLSTLFELKTAGNMARASQYNTSQLFRVVGSPEPNSIPPILLQYGAQIRSENAVIAMKPKAWDNDGCPRFCLFIFLVNDFDDENKLKTLLSDTVSDGRFLAAKDGEPQSQIRWTDNDTAILNSWVENFSEQDMLW